MRRLIRTIAAAFIAALLSLSMPAQLPAAEQPAITEATADFDALSVQALIGDPDERRAALDFFVKRGKLDIVPTLILLSNLGGSPVEIMDAVSKLTGETITDWREAMLWQEAHPEVVPHPTYRTLKLRYFANIDPTFLQFFDPKFTSRDKMKIRLEEVAWGGVKVDGIPSLDNPKLIEAKDADYLLDTDLVFGVAINGDVRAYPLRIMGWHEMFNEVIGGVPVALAYCTLCGSGILFETKVEGRKRPLIFGSSGFLYRSNKLMFDRETNSLWNQFTGEPVGGPLVDENLKLKIRPVVITSWEKWKARNPGSKVLSVETGHFRDYGSGVVYKDYFASPDLMFPTTVRDESVLKRKDYVFGIREVGAAKAWALRAFSKEPVINDRVGQSNVVLIGDANTRTVRAYQRQDQTFTQGETGKLSGPGGAWSVDEDFLKGPSGEKLARVPGHISYWFAWDGYLGVKSELYSN
ncbi:MAG: DUF3179 domain-containing protein [Rhizobiaceae bacterium]